MPYCFYSSSLAFASRKSDRKLHPKLVCYRSLRGSGGLIPSEDSERSLYPGYRFNFTFEDPVVIKEGPKCDFPNFLPVCLLSITM
jgi:hypothetical protein